MDISKVVLTAVIVIACTWGIPAHSEIASLQTKKEIGSMCQRVIDIAMKRIKPHLAEYPDLQNKEDLVLLIPTADINAFANHADQQILFPIMYCINIWYYADALSQEYLTPSPQPKLGDYGEYLNDRRQETMKAGPVDNITLMSYNDFISRARKKLNPEDERKRANMIDSALVEGVMFVLGHEIGHLALKHKPYTEISSAESQKQENAADHFSIQLLVSAKVSIIPALPSLMFFLEREASLKNIDPKNKTHPRAECRMERLVAYSGEINELFKDSNNRNNFERATGYSLAEYQNIMQDLKEDCRLNP